MYEVAKYAEEEQEPLNLRKGGSRVSLVPSPRWHWVTLAIANWAVTLLTVARRRVADGQDNVSAKPPCSNYTYAIVICSPLLRHSIRSQRWLQMATVTCSGRAHRMKHWVNSWQWVNKELAKSSTFSPFFPPLGESSRLEKTRNNLKYTSISVVTSVLSASQLKLHSHERKLVP